MKKGSPFNEVRKLWNSVA